MDDLPDQHMETYPPAWADYDWTDYDQDDFDDWIRCSLHKRFLTLRS